MHLLQVICHQLSYWHRGDNLRLDEADEEDEEEETNIIEFAQCQVLEALR